MCCPQRGKCSDRPDPLANSSKLWYNNYCKPCEARQAKVNIVVFEPPTTRSQETWNIMNSRVPGGVYHSGQYFRPTWSSYH